MGRYAFRNDWNCTRCDVIQSKHNQYYDGLCEECYFEENPIKYYYEIHVTGKNGFSTSIVLDEEMDDSDVILKAYEVGKLEGEDCHYIDYVKELTFEEWDKNFNFDKKD